VGVSAAVFDEEKLLWLNQHYLIHGDPERLGELLREFLVRQGIVAAGEAVPPELLHWAVLLLRERSKTLVELAEKARFLFSEELQYEPEGIERYFTPERVPLLRGLIEELSRLDGFCAPEIEAAVRGYLEREGHKLGEIAQTCRVALTGKTEGPGLFETMEALGRGRTIARLRRAIELIEEGGDGRAA